MKYWICLLGVSLGTFAIRYAFLGAFSNFELPPIIKKALAYVPVSIMAALVGVGFFTKDGAMSFNPAVIASLVAATALSLKWRHDLITIGAGLAAYWLALYFGLGGLDA